MNLSGAYMLAAIRKNRTGATLIEAVVALTIFAFLITSAAGIFKLTIDAERSALAAKNVQESLRYALEAMSKEIRGAQKNTSGDNHLCGENLKTDDLYFTPNPNHEEITFLNDGHICVKYILDNQQLKIKRYPYCTGNNCGPDDSTALPVTPSDIEVDSLTFNEEDIADDQQGRITINIAAKAKNVAPMYENNFIVQTTVSSRYYE